MADEGVAVLPGEYRVRRRIDVRTQDEPSFRHRPLRGLVLGKPHLDERHAVVAAALADQPHRWIGGTVERELLCELDDPLVDLTTEPAAPQLSL